MGFCRVVVRLFETRQFAKSAKGWEEWGRGLITKNTKVKRYGGERGLEGWRG